jgi:Essential protein Yae1, N terminal
MSDDILDSVLDLEEASYHAGFEEGKADGAEAGYAEGMIFGMEKGYQKALEMGKLRGRALMLNACLTDPVPMSKEYTALSPTTPATAGSSESKADHDKIASWFPSLPTIPANPRLKKHVETLLKLTDPETLSVENSDEAVEEFDERMKKAIAKAKVIDKLLPQPYSMSGSSGSTDKASQPAPGSGNIEELGNVAVRR